MHIYRETTQRELQFLATALSLLSQLITHVYFKKSRPGIPKEGLTDKVGVL